MSKDIVVASTTDSQEDVDLAAGIAPAEAGKAQAPVEGKTPDEGDSGQPTTPSEPPSPTPEGEESPETKAAEGTAPPETGDEDLPKPKGGWSKSISRLTKQRNILREELDRKAEENQRLQEKLARLDEAGRTPSLMPEPTAPAIMDELPPEPDENQFLEQGKSYKEFLNALWDWREQKKAIETRRQQAADAQKAEDERLRSNLSTYMERTDEARERYEDWDAVTNQPIPIPKAVHAAIIEMENGPDVVYYLGQHPEVCEELTEMSPIRAVARIGALSANLEVEVKREPSDQPPAPPERKVSSTAPAPIEPLGGGAPTKSSVPIDQLDYREYRRRRDQDEANRYR